MYGFIMGMKNSVDPDQLADLDLHCFTNFEKVMCMLYLLDGIW